MSHVPEGLKYTDTHEWVRLEEDGSVTVGITEYAQEALGDIVFVELPELGVEVDAGDYAGVVESVKAASDIYAPVAGEIVTVNEALADAPDVANTDPYGEGWFFTMKLSDNKVLGELMTAEQYAALIDS